MRGTIFQLERNVRLRVLLGIALRNTSSQVKQDPKWLLLRPIGAIKMDCLLWPENHLHIRNYNNLHSNAINENHPGMMIIQLKSKKSLQDLQQSQLQRHSRNNSSNKKLHGMMIGTTMLPRNQSLKEPLQWKRTIISISKSKLSSQLIRALIVIWIRIMISTKTMITLIKERRMATRSLINTYTPSQISGKKSSTQLKSRNLFNLLRNQIRSRFALQQTITTMMKIKSTRIDGGDNNNSKPSSPRRPNRRIRSLILLKTIRKSRSTLHIRSLS